MSRQVLLILLLIPSAAAGQAARSPDRTRAMVENARRLVAVDADGCLVHRPGDAIVVCGRPAIDREQRLPFAALTRGPGDRDREPLPGASAEIVQQGRCYVTMNERNCFKGLSVLRVGLDGRGAATGGAINRLWQAVSPAVPDSDYANQAMIRPMAPASGE